MLNFILVIPAIVLLIISALFVACGEFLSKKFALQPSFLYVIIILTVYSFGTLFWLPALFQKNQLSIIGSMASFLNLIVTVLVGVLLFGEKLNTLGIIGITLGVAAVIVLSFA